MAGGAGRSSKDPLVLGSWRYCPHYWRGRTGFVRQEASAHGIATIVRSVLIIHSSSDRTRARLHALSTMNNLACG